MFKRSIYVGTGSRRYLRNPDDETGAGDANNGGEVESQQDGGENVPPQSQTQPQQQTAPQVDYRQEFEALRAANQRQEQFISQLREQHQQEMGGIKQLFTRIFDPEGYKKSQEPQYVTREDLAQMREQTMQEFQRSALRERIRQELPTVETQFPILKQAYGDKAQKIVLANWINGDYRTLTEAAKDIADGLEAYGKTRVTNEMAEWEKKKKTQQQNLRGASGTKTGSAPPVSKNGEVPTQGKGSRGKSRFADIDIEQAFKDAEDSLS